MRDFLRPRTPAMRLLGHAAASGCALMCLLQSAAIEAQTDVLQDRVRYVIAQRLPPRSQVQSIDVGQPALRIAACESPLPSLVHPEQNTYGRVAMEVRCEGEEGIAGYLQVSVAVVGDYVVATQRIASGDVVQANMLAIKRGPLEGLPKGAVLKPEQVIGRQAGRTFSQGSTLAQNNFRERWLVERNQRVVLKAQGTGFRISLEGKALDNGSLGSNVRVLSSDGKTLNAQVIGQNELLLRF
nr:flagellar basal body P-ring formation chaperone FlgA [Pseudomonas cichorii]